MQVGVFMSDSQNKASFKDVDMAGAKITGQVLMDGASFGGTVIAEDLQAGLDLLLRDAHYAHAIVMVTAHIGGSLYLRGAILHGLDLARPAYAFGADGDGFNSASDQTIARHGRISCKGALAILESAWSKPPYTDTKTIIGRRLHARALPNQRTEAKIGRNVLNCITNLGMPISILVK